MVALTVAGMIVVFVALDIVLSRMWMRARLRRRRNRARNAGDRAPALDGMLIAGVAPGVFHHRGHMWAHWRPQGEAVAGADDLLHRVLGRIDEVRPPAPGDSLKQGDKAVLLRQGDRVLFLTSPVTGTVTAVNPDLTPDLMRKSPYEKGWIFTIRPERPEEDIHNMMIADRAGNWLQRESRRMRFFVDERINSLAPGALGNDEININGILERLDEETWVLFKDQFVYQLEWRS